MTGIVVEFEGDITSVRRFVVKDAGGRDFVFVAAGDLVFHGAPAGHVGEHQRTGVPVTVRYTVTDGGVLVAEEVFDAGQWPVSLRRSSRRSTPRGGTPVAPPLPG